MEFIFISQHHPDYSHHLARLKVAFADVDDPDKEYQEMLANLNDGVLSLYHAKGEGTDLSIVGEAVDKSYYVWSVAGKGFKSGITELIRRVKLAGFTSVTCATTKRAVRRMYKQFGTNKLTRKEWLNNGLLCTWHELEV